MKTVISILSFLLQDTPGSEPDPKRKKPEARDPKRGSRPGKVRGNGPSGRTR